MPASPRFKRYNAFFKKKALYDALFMKRYYVIFFLFSSVTLIAAILYFAIFFTTQETLTLVRQDIQEEWVGEGEFVAAVELQVGFIG